MANSITASTNSPFSGLLLQDVNFNVSASVGASATTSSTPSIAYANVDYPTVGKFIVQAFLGQVTATAGTAAIGVTLQESIDNVNWNNIAVFASPLVSSSNSSGTASAASVQVLLTPNAKTYLRAQCYVPSGSVLPNGGSGSFGIQTLF